MKEKLLHKGKLAAPSGIVKTLLKFHNLCKNKNQALTLPKVSFKPLGRKQGKCRKDAKK